METISLVSVRFFLVVFFCFVFFSFFLDLLCVCVHHCCPWLLEWSVTEFRLKKKKKCADLPLWGRSFLCVLFELFPHYSIKPQLWAPVAIMIENSIFLIHSFLFLHWSFPVLRVHLRLSVCVTFRHKPNNSSETNSGVGAALEVAV